MDTITTFYVGKIDRHGRPLTGEVCDAVEAIFDAAFPDGWTATTGTGRWSGQQEPTLIATVAHAADPAKVARVAEDARFVANQDAVLHTSVAATCGLATR